eukprot:1161950-Pelagomonas_calceolata.AAC.3
MDNLKAPSERCSILKDGEGFAGTRKKKKENYVGRGNSLCWHQREYSLPQSPAQIVVSSVSGFLLALEQHSFLSIWQPYPCLTVPSVPACAWAA